VQSFEGNFISQRLARSILLVPKTFIHAARRATLGKPKRTKRERLFFVQFKQIAKKTPK
jgi:hypothetical protein